MKRSALLRRTELRSRSYPKPWRRKPEDKVTDAVAHYVLARDSGCIAPVLDMEGPCEGRIELDHVDNAGLGKRGPSTANNLVSLCSAHHRAKTENASAWRPLQRAYLERVERAA